jgi:hypothetical protein
MKNLINRLKTIKQKWHPPELKIRIKRRQKLINAYLKLYRYFSFTNPVPAKREASLVLICDGKIFHMGLADRLRGIVAAYKTSKELGIPFYIHYVHPHLLELFLQPNKYNWKINETDLCYNLKYAVPIINRMDISPQKGHNNLLKKLQSYSKKQIHYYTNDSYCLYDFTDVFATLFAELFKPSELLQQRIDKEIETIGEKFIGLTFRFQNLLGDFNERGFKTIENDNERKELLDKVLAKIHQIKSTYPEYNRFFITSDSVTFLAEARKLPFVHIVGGTRTHIDNTNDSSVETHISTYIDFFVLSKADKLINVITGAMYKSGFPRVAAKIGNIPFERLEF